MFDEVNWKSLRHAYGPATDTPAHLAALMSSDPESWDAAFDHLYSAVLHQGFPEAATAPAVGILPRMLAEDRVARRVRADVLGFLGVVASATAMAEEDGYWQELRAGLRHAVQESYPVVLGFVDSPDARLRRTATEAAVAHVGTEILADEKPTLISLLRARADEPSDERAFWVLLLGELGDDTQRFLADPDQDVAVCAALAPAVAHVGRATDVVVAALSDKAERMRRAGAPEVPDGPVDRLVEYASALSVANSRLYSLDTLIDVALTRAGFQHIAGPAATIVRHADWTGFGTTWGPLVLAAFRPPYEQATGLTAPQRDMLTALVDNPRLWDPKNGSMGLVFRQAGLPYERETCARLARS